MLSLQRIGLISSRFAKNKLALYAFERNVRTSSVRSLSSASETGVKIQNSDLQDITQKSEYVLEEAVDFSLHGPSSGTANGVLDQEYQEYTEAVDQTPEVPLVQKLQDVDLEENSAAMNCHSSVNLYSCMQTNVPEPCNTDNFTHANYRNMPGENSKLLQKYVADNQNTTHPNRSFHWSAATRAASSMAVPQVGTPEGVQGDDCVQYKTWIENCRRFGLTNCDNQLLEMKEGRKTLSQVLAEQEELIRKIAESYGQNAKAHVDSVVNKQQDVSQSFVGPCPQGIQGDDCVRFKLWLENCHKFDLKECDEQLESVQSGRKTLKQVFYEQENMIRSIVNQYQQKRTYSTSSDTGSKQEVGKEPPNLESSSNSSSVSETHPESPSEGLPKDQTGPKLSQRQKLQMAVRDYGTTVIVFHVGISLMSLGGFYLAVSSGLDVVGLLTKMGVGAEIFKSKLAAGASTFVVAYAVHKVFAPVRIAITLSATPFIVRYLRRIGILKVKAIKKN